MVMRPNKRLSRSDWIEGALDILAETGIEGVRIVPLANKLGVTSGSFYWHFKNRGQLHQALLQYWESELTDAAMAAAEHVAPPEERIWRIMDQVMSEGMARYDLAIWHWAQTDQAAGKVFKRVLGKRFGYAKWMFKEAGFSEIEAEARGRLMVVYMMGESTLINDAKSRRRKLLKLKYDILINP